MSNLGTCLINGRGTAKGVNAAARWLERAAERYRQAAASGPANAQVWLGRMLCFGEDFPQNRPETFKWSLEAAKQNQAEAQYLGGHTYSVGSGVAKNPQETFVWQLKAARQGHAKATTTSAAAWKTEPASAEQLGGDSMVAAGRPKRPPEGPGRVERPHGALVIWATRLIPEA